MAIQSVIPIKRGSSFGSTTTYTPPAGGLPNLLGATVTSQVLDSCKELHSLECTLDETGLIVTTQAYGAETATWSTGPAKWDIRIEIGETVIYTDTADLTILANITQA